jgi:hypothetical protein
MEPASHGRALEARLAGFSVVSAALYLAVSNRLCPYLLRLIVDYIPVTLL